VRPSSNRERGPIRGVGVGLRSLHHQAILRDRPDVPWFEVLVDNYLAEGSARQHDLEKIRRDYPMTFHGVGLSLGSTDPLEPGYLQRLKELIERYEPAWCSDHLCWISVGGDYLHDLLPLPYVEEAARHVASRIRQVQDFLGRRILVENVSSYLAYKASVLEEWEFLRLVVEEADCDVLLDVNNVYVSACNHGFDPHEYLSAVPGDRVRELHLAGYDDRGTHLLDTHGARVHPPVWDLYEAALARFGAVPTLVEWDSDIPCFEVLQAEAARAACFLEAVTHDAP
jgi:uncharacterized protein (UPF0276 family)